MSFLEKATKNLNTSVIYSGLFNIISIIINFYLIRFFAINGGLELVGYWTLHITFLGFILVLDFGLRDALTRELSLQIKSKESPNLSFIFSLCCLLFISANFLLYLNFNNENPYIFLLTTAFYGGVLQVCSGWLISFRLAKHEQHWFYSKDLIRIVAQFIFLVVVFKSYDPIRAIGFSYILAASLDAAFTIFVVKNDLIKFLFSKTVFLNYKKIFNLVKDFAALNIFQRIQLPIFNVLISRLAGIEILGILSLSMKLPQVASNLINEGMRPILPSISSSKFIENKVAVMKQSYLIQFYISVPLSIFIFFNIDHIIPFWLNINDDLINTSAKIFTLGFLFINMIAPLYWALQSIGEAKFIAIATFINIVVLTVGILAISIFSTDNIQYFSYLFISSQIIFSFLIIQRSSRKMNFLKLLFSSIRWLDFISFSLLFLIGNLLFSEILFVDSNRLLINIGYSILFNVFIYLILIAIFFRKSLLGKMRS